MIYSNKFDITDSVEKRSLNSGILDSIFYNSLNKALKEMQEGNFSLEDIENAKKNLISSIKMSQDTLGGIVNNYLFNDLDNLPLYEERIKEFKKVTKEEIVALAKKIKLNLTYLLAEEEVQDGRN